jgi:hypothetical protein
MTTYRHFLLWTRITLFFLFGMSMLSWGAYQWYAAGFPLTDTVRNKITGTVDNRWGSGEMAIIVFGGIICFIAFMDYHFNMILPRKIAAKKKIKDLPA